MPAPIYFVFGSIALLCAVTDIRMRPKGTMPGQGVGSPNCELSFRVRVD